MRNLHLIFVTAILFLGPQDLVETTTPADNKPYAVTSGKSNLNVITEEHLELYCVTLAKDRLKNQEGQTMLGVHVRRVDETLKLHLGIEGEHGLVVEHITPGSAAENCGLRLHDVLIRFDERVLENADQFQDLVDQYEPGDRVSLEFFRRGVLEFVTATLSRRSVNDFNEIRQGFDKLFNKTNSCVACHAPVDQKGNVNYEALFNMKKYNSCQRDK